MLLEEIALSNFRNYREFRSPVGPFLNIIIGDNAQGKTNLLEAIYLAAAGKSHRTSRDQEMIRWNADFFRIALSISKSNSRLNLEILYNCQKKKQYKINGVNKNKLVELLGNFNAVLFAPEHLALVKGSPQERRNFLDGEISQTNPGYYHNLQQYSRVLHQRNNLLKTLRGQQVKPPILEVWDQQLTDLGSKIVVKRLEVLKKLNPLARLIHRKITEGMENLEISYQSSLLQGSQNTENLRTNFADQLKQCFQEELKRGYTLVGPHRDDLLLRVNDYDVRSYGSQGQQRTTALALKMAELEFIKSETGQYPVLLLDDVMSELDLHRRMFLLETIQDKIQTFVTATGTEFFPQKFLSKAKVFHISQGKIEEVE